MENGSTTFKYGRLKHRLKKRIVKKRGGYEYLDYLGYQRLLYKVDFMSMCSDDKAEEAYLEDMHRNMNKIVRLRGGDGYHFSYDESIVNCFVWYETPQGHNYWRDAHKLLTEYEGVL